MSPTRLPGAATTGPAANRGPQHPRSLSRRGVLAGAGALAVTAPLTACGSDEDEGSSDGKGEQTGGAWQFKDDRGRLVRLPERPENLVAFISTAAALYDYGIECKGVFGPSSPVRGKPNPQAGRLPMEKLTSLGESYGQFNVEKYAALRPNLLISNMFPPPDLWFVPEESREKIESLAKTVGISVARTSLPQPLRRTAELAESLGADLSAPDVTRAKADFEKAAEAVRTAARDNGGLKVLAMTGDDEQMYVAVPDSYCDLRYFKELGVEFVEGRKSDEWGFWEFLSWENADKYHADLIIIDNRSTAQSPQDLRRHPTWRELPAVKARQTVPWAMEERYSYLGYTPVLQSLAEALRNARRLKA
ncbi:ABC transporter substrate-binding protein [Streptomyces sp. NA04227]|uniref:ABC transporter substrate-binding protein n=1 Tax=Streptomyces sp. NA04227 TaxID=2742136 RepID=UPI0015910075|nr:ABC transporter substrate-binding protein [Streptomyces sp. NA04227]QKW09779.1 ABC transporter substrate-binding protein [Streptomyces sp. NA04227]